MGQPPREGDESGGDDGMEERYCDDGVSDGVLPPWPGGLMYGWAAQPARRMPEAKGSRKTEKRIVILYLFQTKR